MGVDRHGHCLFKGLEEDQRYADQGKDPDDQVHTVIGNEHGLSGHDPFEGPIGHLLGYSRGIALRDKVISHSGRPFVEGGVVLVIVLQQDVAIDACLDVDDRGHDGDPEGTSELPHHIV